MCLGGICMYFFGIQIATFFTGDSTDPTTVSVASLLKIVAFALPSLAIVMVLTGGFRGAGDTFWPFIFTAVGFFLIRIPLAIFLAFGLFEIPYTGITIQGLDWGVAGAVNWSLCKLYGNDLPGSLRLLVDGLREEPGRFLVHEVVFNLCTLYDLCENGGKDKKENIRRIASEWGAEIGQGAFRI